MRKAVAIAAALVAGAAAVTLAAPLFYETEVSEPLPTAGELRRDVQEMLETGMTPEQISGMASGMRSALEAELEGAGDAAARTRAEIEDELATVATIEDIIAEVREREGAGAPAEAPDAAAPADGGAEDGAAPPAPEAPGGDAPEAAGMSLEEFMGMDDGERQEAADAMSAEEAEAIMDEAAGEETEAADGRMDPGFELLASGEFRGLRGHQAEGTASLIEVDGERYLRFEDFRVTNGPDLRVYLTRDGQVHDGVHLEPLKGSRGDQNYLVSHVDTSVYDEVVIYCQPFRVHFAGAELR